MGSTRQASPSLGTVVGETVEVQSVSPATNRRELITCQRNGRLYDIELLDIDITADSDTSRQIAAHPRCDRHLE